MPYKKMFQTDFSPAVKKGLEQLRKDSYPEKRVKNVPKPLKPLKEGVETFSVPTPPTIKLEPQESRRRPEPTPPTIKTQPELPTQKKKNPMPEWAKNERENMRKDKLVDDEYKAGEKARKANMGKAGFKCGGAVNKMTKAMPMKKGKK